MRYKILLIGSGIFWMGMMGLLFHRNSEFGVSKIAPSAIRNAEFETPQSEFRIPHQEEGLGGVEWMGIYLQGNKIGSVMSLTDTTSGGDLHMIERASIKLSLLGQPRDAMTYLSAIADTLFSTKSFTFEIASGDHSLKAEGKVKGDDLFVSIHTGGLKREEKFSLNETYLPLSIEALVAKKGFKEGDRFTFPIFDPTTLKPGEMTVLVGGEETIDLCRGISPKVDRSPTMVKGRLLTLNFLGVETRVWVNERGEVLREEGPMGLVMVRESEKEAQQFPSGEPVEILTLFSIPSNLEIENPRKARFLRVKLEGEDLEDLSIGDERQKIQSLPDGVLVEINGVNPVNPLNPLTNEDDLSPTSLIQSDEEEIQNLAREIVGDDKDPSNQMELLTAWVYENLEKVPTISIPSALDVLKTKEGDCNEHSILFAALSRSLGTPTRIAVGVVYLDGFFYYHAWNRVYLQSDGLSVWVDVDPTFGQSQVDATHIKLAEGELDRQAELANLIGRLKIEVLEYR